MCSYSIHLFFYKKYIHFFANILVEDIYMKMKEYFNDLINHAIDIKASDIYIFPAGDNFNIKMHTNVRILEHSVIDSSFSKTLLNYCKYISNMSISENRRPQIGSFVYKLDSQKYYLRFSSVSNFSNKESMVIRIIYSIEDSDLSYADYNKLISLKKRFYKGGMILFAGPTGSGKTTSAYKLAKSISSKKIIMTIEDPVEIIEDEFLQLQVNDSANMGYDELIKVGLRHRPDIFIIGEIRDARTANAAIRASLSGHLVISTIHANSKNGVINRLKQLNVDSSDINHAINTVVYQKLANDEDGNMTAYMDINEEQ
ncbi:competence protein ComGA [Apilactobacillus timberlakei]|uniref:Competence protein ComGA n=2 Tax=Apilactobacillus timberlakei TaxID=2008380 RepID=A0ABY2YSQ1_9LACO|nr:competence protein ComGA [Apilactobacillus timberlakei]TPR15612.1 competence protein ComGA [Apilactobacillus timberlakei]